LLHQIYNKKIIPEEKLEYELSESELKEQPVNELSEVELCRSGILVNTYW